MSSFPSLIVSSSLLTISFPVTQAWLASAPTGIHVLTSINTMSTAHKATGSTASTRKSRCTSTSTFIGRSLLLLQEANNNNLRDEESNLFDDEEAELEELECYDLCDLDDETDTATAMHTAIEQLSQQQRELQAEKDRVRLEMKWEVFEDIQDCDLEQIQSCGEVCNNCLGRGTMMCRFCHGAKTISLSPNGAADCPCPVCNQDGIEECNKCKGTGFIARWTTLNDFEPEP